MMALEMLGSRISIQDFDTDPPKPINPLHSKFISLMTSKNCEEIKAQLEKYRIKSWRSFLTLAVAAKWLSADTCSGLDLVLSETDWENLSPSLEVYLEQHSAPDISSALDISNVIMELTILFPDKAKAYQFPNKSWEKICEGIHRFNDKSQWLDLAHILFNVKIITSAKLCEIKINIKNEAAALKGMLSELQNLKYPFDVACSRAKIKALYPDVRLSDHIEESLWEMMNKYPNWRDWRKFGLLAAYIKILISDEVSIDEGSLKIQLTKPALNQEEVSMPIQRRF